MERGGATYILTNIKNNVYYIGATSNLYWRMLEHKKKYYPAAFTARYNCNKLVYFEVHDSIETAFEREKQLKNWHRPWKINLINRTNPEWKDLFDELEP